MSLDTLASHNRALLYDEAKDLLMLVLGDRGNEGEAHVYGMRYRHRSAQPGN